MGGAVSADGDVLTMLSSVIGRRSSGSMTLASAVRTALFQFGAHRSRV